MAAIGKTSSNKREQRENVFTEKHGRIDNVQILHIIAEVLVLHLKIILLVILSIYRKIVPKRRKPVKGEIVLVTGSGHGMGKELALLYASEGATVVCWDINKAENEKTVAEIKQSGYQKAYSYVCNVADRKQVMETAEKVRKEIGDVSILINNAGIMPAHLFLEHTVEEIENIMNINVMAHFWTLQAFLPRMITNNHGHIVCLSSCAGLAGSRNLVPYTASKFAVRGIMEALHHEISANPKSLIKFTTIYPWMVNTGLCKNPKIRFSSLTPSIEPHTAAKFIMNAQRRDIVEAAIPEFFLKSIYFVRLYPYEAGKLLMEFLDSYIGSDL